MVFTAAVFCKEGAKFSLVKWFVWKPTKCMHKWNWKWHVDVMFIAEEEHVQCNLKRVESSMCPKIEHNCTVPWSNYSTTYCCPCTWALKAHLVLPPMGTVLDSSWHYFVMLPTHDSQRRPHKLFSQTLELHFRWCAGPAQPTDKPLNQPLMFTATFIFAFTHTGYNLTGCAIYNTCRRSCFTPWQE